MVLFSPGNWVVWMQTPHCTSEEQQLRSQLTPLCFSCKLLPVCPHIRGFGEIQRRRLSLNTELWVHFLLLSPLWGSFLSGESCYSGLIFLSGSCSQDGGRLSIGISATRSVATLKIKPQKTCEFTLSQLYAPHFDSSPKYAKFISKVLR